MKKVILTALAGIIFQQQKNEDGTPKLDKNGKEFGYIRVENPSIVDLSYAYNNGGVKRGQSALVAMTLESWNKSKQFYKEGMEIPGTVAIVESFEQTIGSQPKKAGKGDNAPICTKEGNVIYRKTVFDAKGETEDILISHDNQAEITEFQTVTKEAEVALN